MTQPPAAPTLHPKRCEHRDVNPSSKGYCCNHHKRVYLTCEGNIKHGNCVKGYAEYPFKPDCLCPSCELSIYECWSSRRLMGNGYSAHNHSANTDARERVENEVEESIRKISSASVDRELILHEQIKQERKRIEKVIKELEKDIKKSENSYEGTKYTEVAYRNGLKKAIALLKDGVERK